MRIGHGFDIHRLVEGRELVLGGVLIPHDKGLAGHSDGDALLHAIIDALLGAAALGDIGVHFPESEQAYAGAKSINLLRQVGQMLETQGFIVTNIDSTIICEAPKLSSFYEEMRQLIATTLVLHVNQVSVKAKTMEKLGEIGRGEAIAAEAVALIEKE